jgi:uncharacterized surface anchored protein
VSRHQNPGQNWDIKIANRSFENVSQFRYLGTTVTNQNLIQEEIKRRLLPFSPEHYVLRPEILEENQSCKEQIQIILTLEIKINFERFFHTAFCSY